MGEYMKTIEINGQKYEILKNDANCVNPIELKEMVTDYFEPFDYIFGDFVGDKVRLKGFYESNHKNKKKYNDINYLDYYKKEYCNYGAKTFLLKKVHKK